MTVNLILAGVGGQGTVLASKLIAQAAMDKGFDVRTAETIGMAQRGGCVVSHVRFGNSIYSPMAAEKTADIIIGFEPAEAVRCLPYLKKNATVIVSSKAIKPVTASLSGDSYKGSEMLDFLRKNVKDLIVLDTDAICRECGSPKVLNVALLGAAAASGKLEIDVDDIEAALRQRLAPRFVDMNIKALRMGALAVEKEGSGTK